MDLQQRGGSGRFIRGIEVLSGKSTLKTIEVPDSGENSGLLSSAMARSNVFTRLKDAKRFEISITGRDRKEKAYRIKHVYDLRKKAAVIKAHNLLIWAVLQALRKRKLRTTYDIERVSFSDKKWTKAKAKRMKPLHDVTLTIRVLK